MAVVTLVLTSYSGSVNAASSKTISVAFSSILSGPQAVIASISRGVQAYFQSINAKGGVNGYKYTWTQKDNANDPAQSVAVTHELAATHPFMMVTEGSIPVQAMLPLAKSLSPTPIFALADGSQFSGANFRSNTFGIVPRYTDLYPGMAAFIMSGLHAKDFALAYSDDAVGLPAQQSVPPYVAKHGGKLAASVVVPDTTTDYSPMANQLKESGAKVVLAALLTAPFASLQKAAAAIGYDPKWVNNWDPLASSYTTLAGSLSTGVYAVSFLAPPVGSTPAIKAFTSAIKKYDSQDVGSQFAEQGWIIGSIINEAVQKSTAGGKALSQKAVLKELDSFRNVNVGLETVNYSANEHFGSTSYNVFQLQQNGSAKQVQALEPFPS